MDVLRGFFGFARTESMTDIIVSLKLSSYSSATLHAMQSAVLATAIPSVRLSGRPSVSPSVRHPLEPHPDE